MKFKRIIICGPDKEQAFEDEIAKAKSFKDCIIIGDGKKNITLEEIEEILSGIIAPGARIDFLAHGEVNDSQLSMSFSQSAPSIPVTDIFEMLVRASNNQPIYTHLWCCAAGNAEQDFDILPEGSLAVLHSAENFVAFTTTHASITLGWRNYEYYDGSIEGAKKDLLRNLSSVITEGGSVHFKKSGKKYAIKYQTNNLVQPIKFDPHEKIEHLVYATDAIEIDISNLTEIITKVLDIPLPIPETPIYTPSQLKSMRDYIVIYNLIERDSLTNIRKLIKDRSLDINAQWVDGDTALIDAIRERRGLHIINFLFECNADINLANERRETPLITAALNKNMNAVVALIASGCQLDLQDLDQFTALSIAIICNHNDIALKLIQAGANINIRNNSGDSPLHLAVQQNNAPILRTLLNKGAEVNAVNDNDDTPLIEAVKFNQVDLIPNLIKAGANPDHQNKNGYTALMEAIEQGDIVSTRILLGSTNLDLTIKNNNQKTAIEMVLESGDLQLMAMFSEYDSNPEKYRKEYHQAVSSPSAKRMRMIPSRDVTSDQQSFITRVGTSSNISSKKDQGIT